MPACSGSSSGSITTWMRSRCGGKPLRGRGARLATSGDVCAFATKRLDSGNAGLDFLEDERTLFVEILCRPFALLFRAFSIPVSVEGFEDLLSAWRSARRHLYCGLSEQRLHSPERLRAQPFQPSPGSWLSAHQRHRGAVNRLVSCLQIEHILPTISRSFSAPDLLCRRAFTQQIPAVSPQPSAHVSSPSRQPGQGAARD